MDGRRWWVVIVASIGLALVSLASNAMTQSELEGKVNALVIGRMILSQLLNAGTVWAGLAVLSGWLVRRPVAAAAAGVVALLTVCVVHYGVGLAFGMFEPDVWAANRHWFMAAILAGGPLGLVGARAQRSDLWGMVARLIVPVGAALEPFVLGRFTVPTFLPWPSRVANLISGSILLTAGAVSCVWVVVVYLRRRQTSQEQGVPAEL